MDAAVDGEVSSSHEVSSKIDIDPCNGAWCMRAVLAMSRFVMQCCCLVGVAVPSQLPLCAKVRTFDLCPDPRSAVWASWRSIR